VISNLSQLAWSLYQMLSLYFQTTGSHYKQSDSGGITMLHYSQCMAEEMELDLSIQDGFVNPMFM